MSIKILKIIHAALVLGLLVFAAAAYFSGEGFVTQFTFDGDFYMYLIPSIAVLAYFGSQVLFKKELSKIDKSATVKQKFAKYQAASILKFALIEGAALLALFQFMSTGYSLYFTIAICLIVYLAFQNPTKNKLIQDLDLRSDEQKEV